MEISILNILICVVSIVAVLAWFSFATVLDTPIDTKQSIIVTFILLASLIIGTIILYVIGTAIQFNPSNLDLIIGAVLGITITIIIALVMNNKLDSKTK